MSELDSRPEQQGHREPAWLDTMSVQQTMIEDLIGMLEAQQRAIYRLTERVGRLDRTFGSA